MEPILLSSILVAASCALTAVVIPPLKRIALFFGLTDNPTLDSLKIHTRPIPFLGGFAILIALAASIGLLMSGLLPGALSVFQTPGYLAGILGASSLVWLFGFWDDLKWQVRTGSALVQKIFSQILMAACAAALFVITDLTPLIEIDELVIGILSGAILLMVVNASNIHDGLDGLLAGLALTSALGFFIFFLSHNHLLGSVLSSILAGSLVGFLIFNYPPASIFLGDNGSYVIGALLTILLFLSVHPASLSGSVGPLLMIGMPLVNLGYVVTRRLLARTSPISADRYHLYDRVHRLTGSVRKTLVIHLALQCLLVTLGVLLSLFSYG